MKGVKKKVTRPLGMICLYQEGLDQLAPWSSLVRPIYEALKAQALEEKP